MKESVTNTDNNMSGAAARTLKERKKIPEINEKKQVTEDKTKILSVAQKHSTIINSSI